MVSLYSTIKMMHGPINISNQLVHNPNLNLFLNDEPRLTVAVVILRIRQIYIIQLKISPGR